MLCGSHLTIAMQPRRLDIPDEHAHLVARDAVADARLGEAQRLPWENEEGTTHRQVPDQRPVDAQGAIQVGTDMASTRAQVDR
jgi:hypothetical protein